MQSGKMAAHGEEVVEEEEEEEECRMLYWGSGAPQCWRVKIALMEKKMDDFPQKLVSFAKGEHKSPEILALNPRGQVPTFVLDGVSVNDSVAACLYLESQFRHKGTQLIPGEPAEQAMVYQRTFEALCMYQRLEEYLFYDWKVPKPEQHETAKDRSMLTLREELNLWEKYLETTGGEVEITSQQYLTGRNFTLADVVMFPNVAFCMRFGLETKKFPNLSAYYNRVKERPSIEVTWPPHWNENPPTMNNMKYI